MIDWCYELSSLKIIQISYTQGIVLFAV